MSLPKGIILSTLTGAIIGFALGYLTFNPSCLDICIGSAVIAGVAWAAVGLAFGSLDGVAVALASDAGWAKRPHHFVAVTTFIPLTLWVIALLSTGESVFAVDTLFVATFGVLCGVAYTVGAHGLRFFSSR